MQTSSVLALRTYKSRMMGRKPTLGYEVHTNSYSEVICCMPLARALRANGLSMLHKVALRYLALLPGSGLRTALHAFTLYKTKLQPKDLYTIIGALFLTMDVCSASPRLLCYSILLPVDYTFGPYNSVVFCLTNQEPWDTAHKHYTLDMRSVSQYSECVIERI